MNECPVLLREIDTYIVSCGAHPHWLVLKCHGTLPDTQVMPLCECIILLLENQIPRLSVKQENRNGRLFVPAGFDDGARSFELGLRAQGRSRGPPSLLKCRRQLFLRTD